MAGVNARSLRTDLTLRAAGLILCWAAYAALVRLAALPVPARAAGPIAYALAALGFLGGSAGSAAALLGKHLFDRIEISARWRQRPLATPNRYPRTVPKPEIDLGSRGGEP